MTTDADVVNRPQLKRVLGRWDLVLLFVVAVFNLNVVPSIAANGGVTLWLWLISIVLFFLPQGIAVIAAVVVPVLAGLCRETKALGGLPPPRQLLEKVGPAAVALGGGLAYLGWVGAQQRSITGYLDVTRGWGNTFDGGLAFAQWVWRLLAGSSPLGGVLCLLGLLTLAGFASTSPICTDS